MCCGDESTRESCSGSGWKSFSFSTPTDKGTWELVGGVSAKNGKRKGKEQKSRGEKMSERDRAEKTNHNMGDGTSQ